MSALDATIARLDGNKRRWAQTSPQQRIEILEAIKRKTLEVAGDWARTASDQKQIPTGSPLRGEEWMSGPYSMMSACNGLIETLSRIDGKTYLDDLDVYDVGDGQIGVQVLPHSIWDRLLLSGVSAKTWMQDGVTRANLAEHTATAHDAPANARDGSLSLVLGAGNISSIAPLDCFQKLFAEHSVVILKLNPVNDYLLDVLQYALQPLSNLAHSGSSRVESNPASTFAIIRMWSRSTLPAQAPATTPSSGVSGKMALLTSALARHEIPGLLRRSSVPCAQPSSCRAPGQRLIFGFRPSKSRRKNCITQDSIA